MECADRWEGSKCFLSKQRRLLRRTADDPRAVQTEMWWDTEKPFNGLSWSINWSLVCLFTLFKILNEWLAHWIHLGYPNPRFGIIRLRTVCFCHRPDISNCRHSKNTAVQRETVFSTPSVSPLNTLDWVSVQRSTGVNLALGTFFCFSTKDQNKENYLMALNFFMLKN